MKRHDVIKKVVFREADAPEHSKALFGTVKDMGDVLEVTTTKGYVFSINKKYIVFIKEGDY